MTPPDTRVGRAFRRAASMCSLASAACEARQRRYDDEDFDSPRLRFDELRRRLRGPEPCCRAQPTPSVDAVLRSPFGPESTAEEVTFGDLTGEKLVSGTNFRPRPESSGKPPP